MSRNVEVYELGSVQPSLAAHHRTPRPRVESGRAGDWNATWHRMRTTGFVGGVIRSLSLFVPGTTQLLHGRISRGLFFLTSLLFVVLFCRAVIGTLDRLAPTLELLGSSAVAAYWSLAVAFGCAAAIHLAAVWSSHEREARPRRLHPVLPTIASAIVPGWGQLLNGDRVRSMLFIGGSWFAAAVWIVSSETTMNLLDGYTPAVTPLEMSLRNPATLWMLKWTVPLLVWVLAVYDASASALSRRRSHDN